MEIARSHWLVAITVAALIHAGVATAIFWQDQKASAHSAGIGGIEVSLGPAGGASGAQAAVAPPPPEDPPPEEKKEEEPPDEVVEPDPVEEVVEEADVAVTEDVLPLEPVPEVIEPIEPIEQKPEPEPEPEPIVEEKPEPRPEPEPEPEKVIEEKPVVEPPKQVEAPPPPKPKPQPPKPKVVKKPEPLPEPPSKPVETQVATAPPSVSGVEGKAGTQTSQNAGNADNSAGGGIPGELVDYMSVLQAWLEKHKEYPRGARLRRIEGTTLLYFVMNKGGQVVDFRIQKSSGFKMLDKEVEAMIERAQPLPQIPEDMNRDKLELVVPVQFMLR